MVRWFITCAALPALLLLGAPAAAQQASPRIIGGEDATGDWPWAALIEIDDNPNDDTAGYCSGMALTEQLVVTAAHCFFDDEGRLVSDPGALTVWVGSSPNPRQNLLAARSVDAFQLPEAQRNADTLFTDGRDIALLHLSNPVNLSIFPSLVDESLRQNLTRLDAARRDEALTVIGWGVTDPENPELSDTLQEVQLDYVPFDSCDEAWSFQLTDGQMLCAAELNPIKQQRQDTCQGDSGGPLFLGEDPAPYVIGLTSFGTPNCASPRPTVYTDVFGQIRFIENASATLNQPLVDINFTTDRNRYYTPPNTSVQIAAGLTNDSLENPAGNPSFSYTDSDLDVTTNWSGCSNLSNSCTVAAQLSPGAGRNGTFSAQRDFQSASPSQGTLFIDSSSEEDDYRIKNNTREIPVIFSEQADLGVTARRVIAEVDSGNNGQATIEVTVKNLSYLSGAVANQVELDVTPPSGTSIIGSSANCQSDPCILVSSLGPEQTVTARFTLSTSTPHESMFSTTVSAENGDFPTDNNSASVTFNYAGQQIASSSDDGGGGGGGALGVLLALIGLAGLLRRH
mgnify:CR=1 FL=1